jgi:hypothetical protein
MNYQFGAKVLLTLVLMLAMGACNTLDDIKPKLPDETQEGKDTFGCLVNDELWLPYVEHTLDHALESDYDKGYFSMRAERETGDIPYINLVLGDSTGLHLKTYTRDEGFYPSITIYENGQGDTYTTLPAGGEASITLTKAEEPSPNGSTEVVISGRFSFVAVSSFTGKKVTVKDGRFDLKVR